MLGTLQSSFESHDAALQRAVLDAKGSFLRPADIDALFALQPLNTNFDLILSWQVLPHFLYLGLVAQTICFILWNVTVDRIGAMRATNLLYLSPVITMLAAVAVLNERITWVAIAGCALILAGVALSDSGLRLKK